MTPSSSSKISRGIWSRECRRCEAALRGAKEIGFTVVSISISLLAVFIPILMMGGIFGRLFREFAVTLSVAIAVSMVVSLTTTPMMCAYLLAWPQSRATRPPLSRQRAGVSMAARQISIFAHLGPAASAADAAGDAGDHVRHHRSIFDHPQGLLPAAGHGRASPARSQADQDSSFQSMRGRMTALANTVKSDPAVDAVMAFNGGGFGRAIEYRAYVHHSQTAEERSITADQVIGRLRGKLAQFPGANLYLQPVQDLRVGGRSRQRPISVYAAERQRSGSQSSGRRACCKNCSTLPGLLDVNSDQQDRGLQAGLVIDRATASRLGVSAASDRRYALRCLRPAPGLDHVQSLNQYHVVLEVEPQFWQNPDGLKHIYVAAPGGSQVPLSAFTHYQPSTRRSSSTIRASFLP